MVPLQALIGNPKTAAFFATLAKFCHCGYFTRRLATLRSYAF